MLKGGRGHPGEDASWEPYGSSSCCTPAPIFFSRGINHLSNPSLLGTHPMQVMFASQAFVSVAIGLV